LVHNHPEGIKGAQATAAAIFLARNGKSKEEIKDYITKTFGYNLDRTCDEIRPEYEESPQNITDKILTIIPQEFKEILGEFNK